MVYVNSIRLPSANHGNNVASNFDETHGLDPVSGGGFLSFEQLLLFIEESLNDIDGRLKEVMRRVNGNRARADDLRRAAAKVNALSTNDDLDDQQDSLKGEIDSLLSSIEDPDARAILLAAKSELNSSDPSKNKLTELADQLDAKLSDLDGRNDSDMLVVQGLVAERSRLVGFSTNVIGALNDAMKGIINNVRG